MATADSTAHEPAARTNLADRAETDRAASGRVDDRASVPARPIELMLAIDGLGIGGAEMVLRDLARGLDRRWFRVCVCCTKSLGSTAEELQREGHDVFVLPGQRRGQVDYLTSLKLRRAIVDRHIDIVHTHAPSAFFDAAVCRLTMPRLKVVHTFHYGNYPNLPPRTLWMERLSSRVVDRLVTVGIEQRRQIQMAFRLPERRMQTIWNGAAAPAPDPTVDFRAEVGAGDRLLVGTIAKLIPQKGLEDLLLVARQCRDAGWPLHFVIVGEGPLREPLESRRRELGLEDMVRFTGWVPNASARALPAFDIFFQPSRWEAMSIAVLEAMAAGKAIVATRVGDNPHVLEPGVTGLLIEPGNVAAMVAGLGTVAADAGVRAGLGRAARDAFEHRFTLGHMIRAYEDVYRELAGRDR